MIGGKYIKEKTPISGGLTGSVFKGLNDKTKEKVAIKIIKKENEKVSPEYLKHCVNKEVDIMKKCESENSVKFLDFYEDRNNYFIIMELCDNSLKNHLDIRKEPFSPQEIYEIFSGLNKTFKIMRENKYSHRDIKLENILIKFIDERKTKFIPKLCDYGFSKQIEQESGNTSLGSRKTWAPEVAARTGNYGEKADLWSIGVILYLCYFKDYPYKDIKNVIMENKLEYKKPNNYFLADLIDRLLVIDPIKRMTWEQYFNHPFFKYSSLTEYNIGFQNNSLKYYKAKYQEKENEYKNVLLKEMKQDNGNLDNEELIKDENNLKIIATEEFKDEKGKRVKYFIYEFEEKLNLLNKNQFEILIDNLLITTMIRLI